MTPQERDMLQDFLAKLTRSPEVALDAEADGLIKQACSRRPDATYILVQQMLLAQIALQNAQAQIDRLQLELREARSVPAANSGSFLGGTAPQAAGWKATPPAGNGTNTGGWNAAPPRSPSYAAPDGAGSSFLRSAATTAAGVAGGALLFEGIQHLIGGHSTSGFGMGGFGAQPTEYVENNTVINEYGHDADRTDLVSDDFDNDASIDDDNSDDETWI